MALTLEDRLRAAALDALPAHVAVIDRDGRIVAVNAAWRGFAAENGFPADGAGVGANYLAVCDTATGPWGEEAPTVGQGLRDLLAGRRDEFTLEYPCHAPDRERWFQLLAVPMETPSGRGATVMHLDVTARRVAEASARDTAARYHALFDHNPMPMWVYDVETLRFLAVNQAAIQQYGWAREQFLAMTIAQIRPPEDVPALRQSARDATQGLEQSGVWRHRRRDGSDLQVEVSSYAVDMEGRPARLVLALDVTERVRALRALTASESRLRTILDSEPECVKVVSADGRLLDVNPAGLRMVEAEEFEAVAGRPVSELIHEDDRPAFEALHQQALGGRGGQLRFRIAGLAGTKRWVETHAAPLPMPDGMAVLSVTRDISATVRSERLHALESEVLELISLGGPLVEILKRLCTGLEEVLPDATVIVEFPGGERYGGHRSAELPYRWSVPVLDRQGEPMAALAIHHRIAEAPRSQDQELLDVAGRIVGLVLERDRRDQALAASEERFRQLAENIDEVFWMTDTTKTRMLYVSSAFERIWGTSTGDLYRDPSLWWKAIHHADRQKVVDQLPAQERGEYRVEYRIVKPDGTIRWISDRAFPIRDQEGRVYRIAGLARDVTDERESQVALRERMKELRCLYRVLELTSTGDLALDQVCTETAMALMPSMLWEEVTVTRVKVREIEVTGPGWLEPVAALRSPILDGREQVGFVEVGYREVRPAQPGGEGPFLPEERALVRGVAAHLGRMIQHRRMAETLSQSERLQAVGELTGGVAHDFNNLLTVILGGAGLLAEAVAEDSRLAGIARLIDGAARRGAELTQRLLAFARRQVLAPRAVDVNTLVKGMEPMLRRTLGEHVELTIAASDELWEALVDPGQLENAVLNLCLNARDAMPAGGRLTITSGNSRIDQEYADRNPDAAPGQYVVVSVSDSGTGIDPADLPRVFEPFFTTKEPGRGTGLGLSMVYGFLKQSGGHVRIYSEQGQGTRVSLYLPRALGTGQSEPDPGEGEGVPAGSETILLVEDNELVRRYAQECLEGLGYRVLVAENGPAALDLLERAGAVDLLFTDVVMPGGMNGRELALAASLLRPDLRVLFTSGYAEDAIVHQGRLDAGVHLLGKPYQRAELARAIRTALRGP